MNPAPGCTIGKGNWPPARKLASLPFTAIRVGLGQNLQQVLGVQRLDDSAEIDVRAEDEQVMESRC